LLTLQTELRSWYPTGLVEASAVEHTGLLLLALHLRHALLHRLHLLLLLRLLVLERHPRAGLNAAVSISHAPSRAACCVEALRVVVVEA
jgi:hypothetical protein